MNRKQTQESDVIDHNWDDLRIFHAVANHGSLAAAARALNLATSTVHRRIALLEAHLGGVRLFEPLSTGYALTTLGTQMLQHVERITDELHAIGTTLQNADSHLAGRVSLTTTATLAQWVLPPHVANFNVRYPNIQLDLRVHDRFFSLAEREADIALRTTRQGDHAAVGRSLATIDWGVFASHAYLERTGFSATTPLDQHAVIGLSHDLEGLPAWVWLQERVSASNIVALTDGVVHAHALLKANMGIAALPSFAAYDAPDMARLGPCLE